jgi:hypothetical protein
MNPIFIEIGSVVCHEARGQASTLRIHFMSWKQRTRIETSRLTARAVPGRAQHSSDSPLRLKCQGSTCVLEGILLQSLCIWSSAYTWRGGIRRPLASEMGERYRPRQFRRQFDVRNKRGDKLFTWQQVFMRHDSAQHLCVFTSRRASLL